MTADDIFREAATRGLRLTNLFQLDDGSWRANWRDERGGHQFGNAATPQAALRIALDNVPARVFSVLD